MSILRARLRIYRLSCLPSARMISVVASTRMARSSGDILGTGSWPSTKPSEVFRWPELDPEARTRTVPFCMTADLDGLSLTKRGGCCEVIESDMSLPTNSLQARDIQKVVSAIVSWYGHCL